MWHPTKREEAHTMELRIVSDGTCQGTRVRDLDTGRELQNVRSIYWLLPPGEEPTVLIELVNVKMELTAQGDAVKLDRFSITKKMVDVEVVKDAPETRPA
jgi:hypothetical protein